MARKLKSDKLLFTATLLLVCTSVVMVYSASAVLAHGAVPPARICFLFKQATWALLGLAADADRDARSTTATTGSRSFIWTGARHRRRSRSWRCCSAAPVNGARRWFGVGRLRRAAIGARQDRRRSSSSPRSSSGAWIASTSSRYSLLPIALVVGAARRPDPARAGSRHRGVDPDDRGGDDLRRRHQLPLCLRR